MTSSTPKAVAVVGASLAGFRAVEALRKAGYDGRLTLIGTEAHLPYNRPPLSKQLLAGACTPKELYFRTNDGFAEFDLDLHLGSPAIALDLGSRELVVDGDRRISFDRLIVATGATARTLPGTDHLRGIHLLRTLDDSLQIRQAFDSQPKVVVVGAGFIGLEVAATARARGLDVTVLEAAPVPLVRALGPEMGSACVALHVDHGVAIRCGVGVSAFEGDERVARVRLTDGSSVEADLVVVGVGVQPATKWLESSGLTLGDGVICDETCAASAPGVYAAGDVARWHNPLFETDMRVEHWTNAAEQGIAAARALLAGPSAAQPFAPVPSFWSDQYDTKIQFVGHTRPEDDVFLLHGAIEDRRFVAGYRRAGRLTAALSFNSPRLLMSYRQLIAKRVTWDDALTHAASLS